MKYFLLSIFLLLIFNTESRAPRTWKVPQQFATISAIGNNLQDYDKVQVNRTIYDNFILHNHVTYIIDDRVAVDAANADLPTVSDGGQSVTATIIGGQINRWTGNKAVTALFNGGSHVTLNTIITNHNGAALEVINSTVNVPSVSPRFAAASDNGDPLVISGYNSQVNLSGSVTAFHGDCIFINEGNLTMNAVTLACMDSTNYHCISGIGNPVTVNLVTNCRATNTPDSFITVTGANLLLYHY